MSIVFIIAVSVVGVGVKVRLSTTNAVVADIGMEEFSMFSSFFYFSQ
jgi:hypothetical protein